MATRRCVFCMRSGVTLEHVWPQWIADMMGNRTGLTLQTFTKGRDVPDRAASTLGVTVKRVCAPCNNGWMSKLENEAGPFLKPMIQGKNSIFNRHEQEVVSTWACKTALVFSLTRSGGPRMEPFFREFYRLLEPLPNTLVRALAYNGAKLVTSFDNRALPGDSEEAGSGAAAVQSTLQIGSLILQVLMFAGAIRRVEATLKPQTSYVQLWPISNERKGWPPMIPIDDTQLEQLVQFPRLTRGG